MITVPVKNQYGKYITGEAYNRVIEVLTSVPEAIAYIQSKNKDNRFLKEANIKIANLPLVIIENKKVRIIGFEKTNNNVIVKITSKEINNAN